MDLEFSIGLVSCLFNPLSPSLNVLRWSTFSDYLVIGFMQVSFTHWNFQESFRHAITLYKSVLVWDGKVKHYHFMAIKMFFLNDLYVSDPISRSR